MKLKREDVFEQREPPHGGLAKLRERMTATTQRPSMSSSLMARRLVPIAAVLAIAAVVFLLWRRSTTLESPPDLLVAARQHGGPEEVALGLAPTLAGSAVIADKERATTALAEVRTSNPTVAFYWVSSTGTAD